MPRKGHLERLRPDLHRARRASGVEEVITGFGRTGFNFAARALSVTLDILIIAASDAVHDTVLEAAPEGHPEFFHDYTFSSHPASLVAMDIYAREGLFDRLRRLSAPGLEAEAAVGKLPVVQDVRGFGLLAGVDLAPGARPGLRGYEVQKRLFDTGLHLKATGAALILGPPSIMEDGGDRRACRHLRDVLSTFC